MSKTVLVTGAAGFIGSHVSTALATRGDRVVGLDNLNDYYSPARKRANVAEIHQACSTNPHGGTFELIEGDIRDQALLKGLFESHGFDAVVHLAAMAGVRTSIDAPHLYYDVNVTGTLNLLEAAVGRLAPHRQGPEHPTFVFASTSSVYGATKRIPFVETDPCDRPLAPYPASKRAAELLGHSYYHLFGQPFTALRFFTVYGPRGRPDMMAYKVLDNIFFGREVPLYNHGQMHRDWTYIDDIVSGVMAAVDHPLGYDVINLGRGAPVLLADFVQGLEKLVQRTAHLVPAPMMDADIAYTYADVTKARTALGYEPRISVAQGIERFWRWYQEAVLSRPSA